MTQPILPPEGTYTDAERDFIDNSPFGLWPENQDSNFGQIRKVFTDIVQECIDELNHLGREMFVATSEQYLSLWEEQVGAPIAPAGKSTADRRATIFSLLRFGPFTRARVNTLIEGFLTPTFGAAATFTPSGISLDAGGVPLFSGATDLLGAYRVYYNPQNFSYEVWIRSDVTPDLAALSNALSRITPAHMSFTIDNTHDPVLDYFRTVRNKQPVFYLRMGSDANDSSGYGNNGAIVGGGLAAIASPGLLDVDVADGNGAYDFDGVDDKITVAVTPSLGLVGIGSFSVEAWVRADALPGAGIYPPIVHCNVFNLRINSSGEQNKIAFFVGSGEPRVQTDSPVVVGQVYHVVGVYDAATETSKLYVDGQLADSVLHDPPVSPINATFSVGGDGTWYLNGALDEVAIYDRALTDAEVAENYNTGIGVPT